MKRNNNGRITAMSLIILLCVALLVAWLAVSQLGALRHTAPSGNETEQATDPVEHAQDVVDDLNDKTQQDLDELE